MVSDLLPCPFCGGEAGIDRPGTMRASMKISCSNCGATVESGDVLGLTSPEAFAWNRRPEALSRTGAVKVLPRPDAVSMTCGTICLEYEDHDRRDAAYDWLENHAYAPLSALEPAAPEGEQAAVTQFLPTEDGEFNGNVADIVSDGRTGTSLVFSEGILHVNKDGSGHIIVKEDDFQIESEYDEDGSRSDFWITRFPAGEMQSLRDFLNGVSLTRPAEQAVTEAEPAAAYTIDYLGCEHVSRDVESIKRIAASGAQGPTDVVYLYERPAAVTEAMVEAAQAKLRKLGWTYNSDHVRAALKAAMEAGRHD